MAVAALVTWLITAAGGFFLLARWVSEGGARKPRSSRFPPALIFGHLVLAVAGLVVWIVYLIAENDGLAWTALVMLALVAILGFTMFARWVPSYRARAAAPTGGGSGASGESAGAVPAESRFPVVVVGAHGLFAVATVVLVLLVALGVGS